MKSSKGQEQGQPRLKKRDPNQASSRTPKVTKDRGGLSQFSYPKCRNCGNVYFCKCLDSTT